MSRGRDRDEREEVGRAGRGRSGSARTGARAPVPENQRDTRHRDSRPENDRDRDVRNPRGRGGSSKSNPSRSRPRPDRAGCRSLSLGTRRKRIGDGRHSYRLRRSEFETLEDIGRFRVVAESDLRRFRYEGDSGRLQQDLRSLADQGLIQRRHAALNGSGDRTTLVALTREGKRLVESESALAHDEAQEFYAGFVKPGELAHDSALYRVYQAEAERIEKEGGRIDRVVLDYELKARIYSRLVSEPDSPEEEFRDRQEEVAAQHHLRVVDGRIPLPDLRIEYCTADGDTARVDLELTTEHYKSGQIAAKAWAGFKLYVPAGSVSSGGTPVRDEREITAGILSA